MKHKKVTSFISHNHTSDACTIKSAMPATSIVDHRQAMPIMYSSHWSGSGGSLIRRPMRLPVIQKLINYRNHTTLMDMNPLLSPIFLHATSICNCQWDGSCRERALNERSVQSPRTTVSYMTRLLSDCYLL